MTKPTTSFRVTGDPSYPFKTGRHTLVAANSIRTTIHLRERLNAWETRVVANGGERLVLSRVTRSKVCHDRHTERRPLTYLCCNSESGFLQEPETPRDRKGVSLVPDPIYRLGLRKKETNVSDELYTDHQFYARFSLSMQTGNFTSWNSFDCK